MFHQDIQTPKRKLKIRKYDAQRSTFDEIRGVWIADETQSEVHVVFACLVLFIYFGNSFTFLFKVTSSFWWINYNRIGICRRALDAEMKDATKEGLHIKVPKGGERICHGRRRKKILGAQLTHYCIQCMFAINFFI